MVTHGRSTEFSVSVLELLKFLRNSYFVESGRYFAQKGTPEILFSMLTKITTTAAVKRTAKEQ